MGCSYYNFIKVPILGNSPNLEIAPLADGDYIQCQYGEDVFLIREDEARKLTEKLSEYFKWLDNNRSEYDN